MYPAGPTFKPGTFVRATLSNPRPPAGSAIVDVVVPAAAVFSADSSPYVFVARDGVMKKTGIRIGNRLSDSVVVSSGLAAEDQVVVGPLELLGDGKPLPAPQTKAGAN